MSGARSSDPGVARVAGGVVGLALLASLASNACRKYEDSPDFCASDSECPSFHCDVMTKKCMPLPPADAGAGDQGGQPSTLADGGIAGVAGAAGGLATDGGAALGGAPGSAAAGGGGATGTGRAGAIGAGGGAAGSAPPSSAGGGASHPPATGGAGGASPSGAGSGGASPSPPDAGTDARGGCTTKADCASTPATPVCDATTRACVGCLSTADCGGTTPSCNPTTRTCVECLADSGCASAAKPFCAPTGSCVGCAQAPAGAAACGKKDAAHPVCGASGACVACAADTDCHDAAKPFCAAATSTCVPCSMASAGGAAACAKKDAAHPVCGASGACVACAADADCHDDKRAFCSGAAGECVSCAQAPAGGAACSGRDRGKPACSPSGACVACVTNADCPHASPVCSGSNTCGRCGRDADCADRSGPGVCMSHQDGRCADDAETLYVQTTSSCVDAPSAAADPAGGPPPGNASGPTATAKAMGGSSAAPLCTLQAALGAVSGAADLIVVRGTVTGAATAVSLPAQKKLSVVGQMTAFVAGGATPAFHLASGEAFLRDLKLTTAASIGLQADAGSILRLDHVTVTGNLGGGVLLDGAAFEIHNTTVTNNGAGVAGAVTWGGIFANSPPAAGPMTLDLVTVQNNASPGVTCSVAIAGSGVLASGNLGGDVVSTCGFASCGTAGASCGAR